ncbi:MAG TPA: M50 family metallopeptidase [Candidatus Saccharimonadales bacterium]|jgi:regulator of sigma E protease|nr:M50 family metallopeptidase [Candidatus Saccharimonadales bacterium]
MSLGLLVLGLVLFVLLIVVHEFGHFIMARINGVDVEEFGIFFPPRLWSKKTKTGWTFSLNAIPLGGFVRLKGEHDDDTGKRTYGASPLSTKVKILIAGVTMNVIVAFIMLTSLAWLGMPQLVNNQFTVKSDTRTIKSEVLVGYVLPGSPAAKAGLRASDELYEIIPPKGPAEHITTAIKLPPITKSVAGQTIKLIFIRNKHQQSRTITLLSEKVVIASQKTKNPKANLGVAPTQYNLQRSTWAAPVVALGVMKQFTVLTFKGVGSAISNLARGNTAQASSQITGPVGIFAILKEGSLLGYQFILMIVAVISLSLAIMNILPIPVLDGGKLFATLISRLFRKKLSAKVENGLYGAGLLVLLVLFTLITIVDVKRFF